MVKSIKTSIWAFLGIISIITLSYFVWLVWSKLTTYIGDSWAVFGILGAAILIFVILGILSFDKVWKRLG